MFVAHNSVPRETMSTYGHQPPRQVEYILLIFILLYLIIKINGSID